jgi:nucleotide-binding universal stress UspA family protein
MKLDLIVMRAHQSDSILEKIIGSTTDRVVRASCAPVLVVKRPVMHAYQRVVVSIDTTDGSIALVSYMARLLPRVKLSLLHVVQIPPQFEAAMLQAGSGHSIAAYREDLVDKAKTLLHEQSQKLDQSAITSTVRVVAGEPATTLVQATWNPKVGLIVLGPGSTGKIRRALLGSVTQRVLRNAACDVLICRTDQLEERE